MQPGAEPLSEAHASGEASAANHDPPDNWDHDDITSKVLLAARTLAVGQGATTNMKSQPLQTLCRYSLAAPATTHPASNFLLICMWHRRPWSTKSRTSPSAGASHLPRLAIILPSPCMRQAATALRAPTSRASLSCQAAIGGLGPVTTPQKEQRIPAAAVRTSGSWRALSTASQHRAASRIHHHHRAP
jgi:hypothetical protein